MVVHLLNRLTFPINLLASGLNASDADVLQVAGPTETLTWTWSVPLDVRPLPLTANAGHLESGAAVASSRSLSRLASCS